MFDHKWYFVDTILLATLWKFFSSEFEFFQVSKLEENSTHATFFFAFRAEETIILKGSLHCPSAPWSKYFDKKCIK